MYSKSEQEKILLEIEDEIKPILEEDKKSWVKVYRLMERVESEKLYQENYHSFTSWVNHLSIKFNINVSLLWKRKKAGKFYSEYYAQTVSNVNSPNDMPTALEDIRIAPESLNLIEKISCGNMEEAHKLIKKVQENGLSRSDLKNAWQSVKATREANSQKVVRTNSYDRATYNQKTNANADETADTTSFSSVKVTAKDIVLALTSVDWLPSEIIQPSKMRNPKYKLMTEFPVQSGDNRHAKRIDALVLENLSVSQHNHNDIHIHAIEVKVSKYDLLNDQKMSEYTAFSDFFWIAVPSELKDVALSYIPPNCGWGLLLYEHDEDTSSQQLSSHIKVEVMANMNVGSKRTETLSTAVLKLL